MCVYAQHKSHIKTAHINGTAAVGFQGIYFAYRNSVDVSRSATGPGMGQGCHNNPKKPNV